MPLLKPFTARVSSTLPEGTREWTRRGTARGRRMPGVGLVEGTALGQQLEALARTAKRKQTQMMPMLPAARPARTLAKSVTVALVLPAQLPGLAYADRPRPPPSVPAAVRVSTVGDVAKAPYTADYYFDKAA